MVEIIKGVIGTVLMPQGDHLIKGCRYWRENSRIFAPKAALLQHIDQSSSCHS